MFRLTFGKVPVDPKMPDIPIVELFRHEQPRDFKPPKIIFQALPDGEVLTASHWGLFYAKTKDGRLVAVRPFEGDRAPSPNLSSLVEHPYSSARIQTPMVRRSYLERGQPLVPGAVRMNTYLFHGTRL